ncbi:MAG: glycosyltransferase family 2 protein [Candidatus Omnitrophica bacterium]|nr:glycosyltransferase family 2 protein [Candidatus Omnitrophota bacterium]
MNNKLLSIIVTSYNEEKTIAELLDKVIEVPLEFEKEIIVVDGKSTDRTREILKDYEIKNGNIKLIFEEKREGKGAALKKGFKIAKGDLILIQDADLEVTPEEYPKLVSPITRGDADVIYGSRFKNGKGLTPIGSYIGNQIITWSINVLFLTRLTDIATCYKVFRKKLLDCITFSCNGFDFDAEFTAKVLRLGKKIVELPIAYNPRNRREGKKLNWIAGITSLWAIVKNRLI